MSTAVRGEVVGREDETGSEDDDDGEEEEEKEEEEEEVEGLIGVSRVMWVKEELGSWRLALKVVVEEERYSRDEVSTTETFGL